MGGRNCLAWNKPYDPEFDVVYIGTGNGAPWNRRIRSPEGGDNLFLSSIVALDADTGEYRWHYQTSPGDTWDYTSTMDKILADLEIDGRVVKALLHAPKNGFFYVLDRSNGKLISAEPFTKVTWATHVDLVTGRPVETEDARYTDGEAEHLAQCAWRPQLAIHVLQSCHRPGLYANHAPGWSLCGFWSRYLVAGTGLCGWNRGWIIRDSDRRGAVSGDASGMGSGTTGGQMDSRTGPPVERGNSGNPGTGISGAV